MNNLETYKDMLVRAKIIFEEYTIEGVTHIDVCADDGPNQDGYCNFTCSHQFKDGALVRAVISE